MTPEELKAKQKEYQAAYRAKNREKQALAQAEYRKRPEVAEKAKEYSKKYFQEHKEKYAEYQRNRGTKRNDYMKEYREKNREYLDAYKKQWYRTKTDAALEIIAGRPRAANCEVCGNVNSNKAQPVPTVFDHCHVTGHFRGWICNGCNTALGHVKDNPETLRKLADYLDNFKMKLEQQIEPSKEEVDLALDQLK